MGRVHRQFADKNEWFFKTWNADSVKDGKSGKKVRFEEASAELLATDPDCWVLHPGETWHGFGDLEDDYCMLDPIKVSVVTPGVADKGGLDKRGIPATLVTAYLHHRGVEVEKTTDFTICSCSRSASRRASGARCSTPCSTSSATTTERAAGRRCCRARTGHPNAMARLGPARSRR